MYNSILIPADGSELSGKAATHLAGLARRLGASVTALRVVPPFHVVTADTRMVEDTLPHCKIPVLVDR
jgi:nucleotide-binding universal stress UspA family protein